MMARNDNIRTVIVSVHLGGAPSFDIRADEDATATPTDCRYSGRGAGPADRDFLLEILRKVEGAYSDAPALALCLDGVRIEPAAGCR